ncbi:guanine nucleotide exchange factor synembryn [Fusarium austroafricanum]|uniref:Guanine nucleotide exchange factor synembryn n=1 Tax=Fusarium austroafricanum TaxID=2364996 RepID=A0A8H4KJ89_9HYPO|nr:guanine nucleotide exchange factor synembryn [Fusarium austroafricanum]
MATPQILSLPTGTSKLKAVTERVEALTEDLEDPQNPGFEPDDRANALEQLKLYSRDLKDAEPLYTEESFTMLLRQAFDCEWAPFTKSSRAAMRVICNLMFQICPLRQVFIDKGFAPKACKVLKSKDYDDEFLVSRIILLATYDTKNLNLEGLIENEELANHIIGNLAKHAELMNSKAKSEPIQDMALIETLKLLFNVTHYCLDKAPMFNAAVPHLAVLLFKADVSQTNPLDPPVGFIVNGFLNLDLGSPESQEAIHPKEDPEKVVARFIDILDAAIRTVPDQQKNASVMPVVSLIRTIHQHAPDSSKKFIREKLLPTEADREEVLGKGDSLPAKLLQNSTNPIADALRVMIQHLLFEMSDKDAHKFVENVGYGLASGFLFENNIPVPVSASEAKTHKPINPITGQFVDAEKPVEEPEMTEEEKEREAERLFVLFERLKKTGIVDIQNPVEAAVREGRYRELKDDEVEELD